MLERVRNQIQTRFELAKSFALEKLAAFSEHHAIHSEGKRPFNHEFIPVLEKYFEFNEKPSAADQAAMAEKSGMSRRQIEVWFQNRRRRMKQQFGDKRTPRRCAGFSYENVSKLQNGLPEYLLHTGVTNPVDLVEHVVSAEWEAEMRDLRPEKKYSSFYEPILPRDLYSPNPLNTSPSPVLPSFKPVQFQDLIARPRDHFPEPQWSRKPYVAQPTVITPVKKPRGRAAQIAKANPQRKLPTEMEGLIIAFSEQLRIDDLGVPEEYRLYYFGRGPRLPPAATYAKDVRPPTGRHPAFVVPGSREIPGGLLPPLATTPVRRKKAGLPRRTPKNPQIRVTTRPSPSPSSASSRSPSPPSTSRTPSLTSSISTSSSRGLRRNSSVASFSDPDSPLFSPISLPCDLPQVHVAGSDSPSDLDRDHFLLQEQKGMKISFPSGFEAFTNPSEIAPAGMTLFEVIFQDMTLPPQAFELSVQQVP